MLNQGYNVIGWKEWFHLEKLGLPAIKGKIDTGAKTSSLHAFNIESFYIESTEYVRFDIHPIQKNKKIARTCISPVTERRVVCDSGGRREKRIVVESEIVLGEIKAKVELTLANRDSMRFRMLMGRDAIKRIHMLVDVSRSFVHGKIRKKDILRTYKSSHSSVQQTDGFFEEINSSGVLKL